MTDSYKYPIYLFKKRLDFLNDSYQLISEEFKLINGFCQKQTKKKLKNSFILILYFFDNSFTS